MPITRQAVAQKIAGPLHELEHTIDVALAHAGTLAIAMAVGRSEAKVACEVGQEAFDGLGDTLTALTVARRHIVYMHRALADTRDRLRLPVTSYGDESEKLLNGMTRSAHLKSVA